VNECVHCDESEGLVQVSAKKNKNKKK